MNRPGLHGRDEPRGPRSSPQHQRGAPHGHAIHLDKTTTSTPEPFIAGSADFGPGRRKLFGNSADDHVTVHDPGPTEADVAPGPATAARPRRAQAGARRSSPKPQEGRQMATTFDSISAPRGGRSVAGYGTYDQAQHAVDHLSDNGFPVENADIIGSDLRLVEHVTGRITTGRAALAGAGTGAWLGLFFGLLVGLFTTGPTWVGLLLGGLVIGAVWGAIFGFFAQWATGGRRDFSSERGIVAGRYDVVVPDEHAERARELLAQLPSHR